jgi:hypothetical protein
VKPRDTLILAFLVAALGAFLWFYELGGEEERARAESAKSRLFPEVSAEAIGAVELRTNDEQDARLERDEEGWRIVRPIEFRADALAADGLASALADLSSEAVYEEPEPLANYGLDVEPRVRFEVGDEVHTLRVGNKTPVGGNTYAAADDAARVFAVPTWRITGLSKSLRDLRDRQVMRFDRDAVTRLRASWPGERVEIVRGEDGAWRLVHPLDAPADESAIDNLLATLEFLRAEGFEDDPVADARSGLASPAFAVELDLEGVAEPLRLVVGSTEDGLQRYVQGPVSDSLYKISATRLDDFPRSVTAYRLRTLARFTVSDAERFEIAFEEAGARTLVTGERTERGWETSPERLAAGKASRLVAELATLEARDIAAEAVGDQEAEELGLRPPRATVRVFGVADDAGDGPVLAEVRLGLADPGRGIAAQRPGDEVVYWLDFALAEHVPVSLGAFRNRFVAGEEEGTEDEGVEEEPAGVDPTGEDAVWNPFGEEGD